MEMWYYTIDIYGLFGGISLALVIGILSGKGGTGKSLVASGLAKALSGMGKRVLVAGCRYMDSLDIDMGLEEQTLFTFSDIWDGNQARVERSVVFLSDGLAVCPPPSKKEFDYRISVCALISQFSAYDYIILDDPAEYSFLDKVIIVTTPLAADVRAGDGIGFYCKTNGIESLLVVNKLPLIEGVSCNVSSIIDSTYSPLTGGIPFTWNYTEKEKRAVSPVIFDNMAKRLEGMSVPLFSGIKQEKKYRSLTE